MKCSITGIETTLKFNNVPVSRMIMEEARQLVKDDKMPSTKHALAFLEQQWQKQMNKIEAEVGATKELVEDGTIELIKDGNSKDEKNS